MGFKIEIILICIAVFLSGCIIAFIALSDKTPDKIELVKSGNVASKENEIDKIPNDNIAIEKTSGTSNKSTVSNKININIASREELIELNGIGEVIAQRIIEYRTSKKFTSINDIKNVKGIGDKKFEAIKNIITVN